MNFISKNTVKMIVFSALLFTNDLFAHGYDFLSPYEKSLYTLAINKKALQYYDEPSVSPDGQWIAYTVKEKIDNPKGFQFFLPDGMPTCIAGSHIYLSSQDGHCVRKINPKKGYSWRPVWSPNGEKLAFYSNASGKCSLWIYDLSSGLSKELSDLQINTSIFPDDKPVWNPDGTEIFVPLALSNQLNNKISYFDSQLSYKSDALVKTFNAPKTQSDYSYSGEETLSWLICSLAAVDINTRAVRIVISDQAKPAPCYMKLSSSGRWLSYRAIPQFVNNPARSSFHLVINSASGALEETIVAENLISEGGKDYIWHPSKDILVYEKDRKMHLVELDDKGVKRRTILCNESPIEFIKKPLLFTADGNFLLVGGRPYPDSYREKPASLFLLPVNDNCAPIEIPIKSPWKYLSTISTTESEAWQSKKGEIAVILENEATGETAIVQLDITQSISTDQGHFAWQGAAKLQSFPAKRNFDIIYWIYEDLVTPENIYYTGSDFSSFTRVSAIEPKLDQLKTAISKVFETPVPTYDGTLKKVKTTVLLPADYNPATPPPAVVLFYPGSSISNWIRKFAGGDPADLPNFLFLHYGYALILPDIPLKPDGEVSHRIHEIINTLLPQVYHAINLNLVDPTRLGIAGHSYGGYSTAAVITQTQLFKAAVANAGVYDLGGFYGCFDDSSSHFSMDWLEHGQGGMGMPPWNNLQHYFENSPYYLADKIHTPLLLVHGEDDPTCPVIEARKMFAALKRLNQKAELAIYPGEGHVMFRWNQASALDGSLRVVSFFNKYLLKMDR